MIKMIEMSQIRIVVNAPRAWRHFFLALIRSPKSGWRFLTVFLILLWPFTIMNRYSLILINLLLQKYTSDNFYGGSEMLLED